MMWMGMGTVGGVPMGGEWDSIATTTLAKGNDNLDG